VRDQVSHPRQTKIKVTLLYTLPFICCVTNSKTEHCAQTDRQTGRQTAAIH